MAKQSPNQQDKVTAFLVGLATDPARLGRFIQSPDAELEAAGIDEADRSILKSGNAAAIHARIGGQPAAPQAYPVFMTVSMTDDGEGGTRPAVAQALPMVFAQQMMPPMFFAHPATPMLFMMNASASPTLPLAPPAAHSHAFGVATPMLFMMNASASPTLPMAPPASHSHAFGVATPMLFMMNASASPTLPMVFAQQMMPPMIFAHPATPMLFMMNASESPTLPLPPPVTHPHALGAAAPMFQGPLMPPMPMPASPFAMMSPTMSPFPMPTPMMMQPMPFPMPMPTPTPMMMQPMPSFYPLPYPMTPPPQMTMPATAPDTDKAG